MAGVMAPVFQRTLPVPVAVRVAVGLVQVRMVELGLMAREGAVCSALMLVLATLKQPLALTTVTE
jgi:hypothetical protein